MKKIIKILLHILLYLSIVSVIPYFAFYVITGKDWIYLSNKINEI